jgi:hypothetical protein
MQMYIQLFLILYADDTALMAESSDGSQKTLNCFEKCCDLWKLTVNTTKTKVVIFSKKKVRQNQSFKIKGQNIEIIDSYCYLGTFSILRLTITPIGYLPSSPYTIYLSVVLRTLRMFLQNCKCTFSIHSLF